MIGAWFIIYLRKKAFEACRLLLDIEKDQGHSFPNQLDQADSLTGIFQSNLELE